MNPDKNKEDKNKEDKKIEYEEEEIKDLIYEEKLREQLKKNGYEVGEDVCEVKCVRAIEKVVKGKSGESGGRVIGNTEEKRIM
jgi:hypothetical protein